MDDALAHLQKNDPIIGALIDRYDPPRFITHTNYYETLVESIISQQLSVKAAQAIGIKFKALFGDVFPTPDQLLQKDIEELRSAGLSRPKARYMQDLAYKMIDGTITFDTIDSLSNEDIVSELTKVKGIGEWTVHMFLMFCMGRLDVLPTGDLGIRNGVATLYEVPLPVTPDGVNQIATKNNWHPYESVASWYVWQSLNNAPKR